MLKACYCHSYHHHQGPLPAASDGKWNKMQPALWAWALAISIHSHKSHLLAVPFILKIIPRRPLCAGHRGRHREPGLNRMERFLSSGKLHFRRGRENKKRENQKYLRQLQILGRAMPTIKQGKKQ